MALIACIVILPPLSSLLFPRLFPPFSFSSLPSFLPFPPPSLYLCLSLDSLQFKSSHAQAKCTNPLSFLLFLFPLSSFSFFSLSFSFLLSLSFSFLLFLLFLLFSRAFSLSFSCLHDAKCALPRFGPIHREGHKQGVGIEKLSQTGGRQCCRHRRISTLDVATSRVGEASVDRDDRTSRVEPG